MTTATASPPMITPPAVAKRYGVTPETVIGWIRAGELRAIDVSRRGAKRPRYRVDPADLVVFEAGRAVGTTPKGSRRRRRKDPGVEEFF